MNDLTLSLDTQAGLLGYYLCLAAMNLAFSYFLFRGKKSRSAVVWLVVAAVALHARPRLFSARQPRPALCECAKKSTP